MNTISEVSAVIHSELSLLGPPLCQLITSDFQIYILGPDLCPDLQPPGHPFLVTLDL